MNLNKIPFEKENLPLGDFTWSIKVKLKNNEKYEYLSDYIIERKVLEDL